MRKPRIEYYGAFHHIIVRGNNKQVIFKNISDYGIFEKYLSDSLAKIPVRLHGYVLMSNHFHFLTEITDENNTPSKLMQTLLTKYAKYFNYKYDNTGHVFQGRYKAILCDKDNYLLQLIKYIHLNPARANIIKKLQDYTWSSYPVYLNIKKANWVYTKDILEHFGNNKKNAIVNFRKFINDYKDNKQEHKFYQGYILGKDNFIENVKNRLSEQVRLKPRHSLDNLTLKQLASLIKSDVKELSNPTHQSNIVLLRKRFCYLAHIYAHKSNMELAIYLKFDLSAISKLICRYKKYLENNDIELQHIKSILQKAKSINL